MSRITSLVIVPAMLLVALFATTVAGEGIEKNLSCSQQPIANTINLKLTWIKVQGGNLFFFKEADMYNVWERRIGFGIDTVVGSGNFFDVRPYATFSVRQVPLTFLAGYDAVSDGSRFVEYGAFYPWKMGEVTVSAGIANFSAVSQEARDYLDSSVIVIAPLNNTHSAGLDVQETHRWDGKSDNLFAGPVLYSKIGPLILTTRFQVERHLSPGSRRDNYIAFIGIRIPLNPLL